MDHVQAASEALDNILNPYDLRRPLADFLAAVMWDGEDDADDDADESEEEEDGEDEDEDDDDDEEEDPKPKGKGRPSRRQVQLQKEAARRRVENNTLKKERDDLAKRLKAHEDKDKSKGEKAEGDLKQVTKERDELQVKFDKLAAKVAVRDLADEHKVTDVAYFKFLLSEEGIELDEDGEWPDDSEKAVKKLVRKHKARLVGSADDGEDDDDDDGDPPPPRVSATGRGQRKGTGKNAQARKQELVERFPALAGRR